jgi:hypothetical protein
MRWWVASPISRPPPSAVPFIAATTGLPSVSSLRSWAFTSVTFLNTSGASAGVALIRLSRSPPAKKVFFADVMITPVMLSLSLASASTHSPMAAL